MTREISHLIEQGLCLIPVYPKSKNPSAGKGWQKRTVQDNNIDDFSDGSNVGVLLGRASGGLVDIDLDSDIARQVGHRFLPPTGWVFGRNSAPRSHFIFKCIGDAGRGEKFTNSGKMVVEYRAEGQQTVFPPSFHESGEPIQFVERESIGEASRADLLDAAGWIAGVDLVARQYEKTRRQDTILALAGTLLRGGKAEKEVVRFVEAICVVTVDDERSKRLDAVRSTIQRMQNNEGVTQKHHLIELIGEKTVNELCRYLRITPKTKATRSNTAISTVLLSADDMNDMGLAKVFSGWGKDRLLFVGELTSFYVYRDGIWEPDSLGLQTAKEFDKFIEQFISWLRSRPEKVNNEQCATQIPFLLKYRNRTHASNAIKQARSFLSVPLSKLDQGDCLVAVRNGVLNLRDGELMPFSPKHYVTKRIDIKYDPEADCPLFKKLLSESFEADESLVSYAQGIFGYCLTGLTNRQDIHILHGSGANGKSTILDAVMHVLGPYAGALMSETIFEGAGSQHSSDLYSMRGKRLGVVHEAESRFRLNAPRIKQLTGGDTIKVKGLYENPIEMKPQFKIFVLCNKRPNLDAHDDALKRRIKLIPFEYVVPREKRDARLGEKLREEASGILRFLVEGAAMHFRGDIRQPSAVENAIEGYFSDQDSVRNFLQYSTKKDPKATIGKAALYDAYTEHCIDECLDPLTKGEFGKILRKIGFEDTRAATERKWKGLRLLSAGENPWGSVSSLPFQAAG